jgi:amino acid adenylation domain-containing protein
MSIVHHLVAQTALAKPQAIALEAGAARLTYGELNARANRAAADLKTRGAAADQVIGVCLPRSFDQIVACLAVLESGAAYLPLDPDWPHDRLRQVLDDAGAAVVITTPPRVDNLSSNGRTAVALDNIAVTTADGAEDAPAAAAPDHLAYVIYTSGSTGAPKGVEVTQGNLANLVAWHRQAFGLTPADRVSHLAGLSFDASVWEVWGTLSAGATLVLADETVRMSAPLLRDWLIDNSITVAFVPTVLAEPLMKAGWPTDTVLRFLLTGADTLHSFPPRGLPFAVVNNYGPTECTVVATSGLVPPQSGQVASPTIGTPISNAEIYLLDSEGKPVADGESGEIYIGGHGVARGYRNRADLTAQRFLRDPFSGAPDARMYRTGDRGRYLPDGQIVFQGRVDNQEKIRGYRVEPDGIATALNRHPAVASSAIVADGNETDRRLVAYVVPSGDASLTADDLREFLAQSLPDHMIPSMFLKVAALPQNSSGKLNKCALPKAVAENALPSSDYRAPATPAEQRVAAIVAKVLGAERVGADDNFFLIGGHSLLGTQVVLQVRQAFGIDLTLRHLFTAPTVASLAASVERLAVQKIQSMSEEEAQWQAARLSVAG